MITSKNRINRRTMLRGAGGIAIGLPFLSAMLRPGRSHAAEETKLRFVVVYTPGGTLLDRWLPTGDETNFTLSPMLSPLEPFKSKLTFVNGTDLKITSIGSGSPHSRGMSGLLTGQELLSGTLNTNGGDASFANGPSVDQVIAETLSKGLRFKSLEVSAGWSTGISVGGQPHPANAITFAGPKQPIPPATDPYQTFQRVFAETGVDGQATVAWNKSILDAVAGEYGRISAQLGSEDRVKLDAHLAQIRDLELRLEAGVSTGCVPPTNINSTPGYYEDGATDQSRGDLDGGPDGIQSGIKVPEKGRVMTDVLTTALACDLTRVGTMQWADSEAKFLLNFLERGNGETLADHHHAYQHDKGFQPDALEIIYKFYNEQVARLLANMDAVVEGNGLTMLDNSIVFHVSEIQKPDSHGQDRMPFMLAGKAGGKLSGGRVLPKLQSQLPHNDLLVSLLNLCDVPATTFGHPEFCTGVYPGLA